MQTQEAAPTAPPQGVDRDFDEYFGWTYGDMEVLFSTGADDYWIELHERYDNEVRIGNLMSAWWRKQIQSVRDESWRDWIGYEPDEEVDVTAWRTQEQIERENSRLKAKLAKVKRRLRVLEATHSETERELDQTRVNLEIANDTIAKMVDNLRCHDCGCKSFDRQQGFGR